MNIKQTLIQNLRQDVKIDLERKLEKVRVPCMNYLKENALRIFKEKITEVYQINSDRIQVIDLPLFLRAIKTYDIDKWSFSIKIDEDLLDFKTKSGEQIYQYTDGGKMFANGYGEEVHNLREYWHSPIMSLSESDWYKGEFAKTISEFLKSDFINFVKNKIMEAK